MPRVAETSIPTRDELLRWIAANPDARRSDVLEAFAVAGPDKVALKRMLRDLAGDGEIDLRRRKPRPKPVPVCSNLYRSVGSMFSSGADGAAALTGGAPDGVPVRSNSG